MSNFLFLKTEWPEVFFKMKKAEERISTEPVSSANYCRLVLEETIYKLYEAEYLDLPFNKDLVNLMNDYQVKNLMPYAVHNGLHIVRKTGNNAAHYGNRVTREDALISIKYLYAFLKWFAGNYAEDPDDLPGVFDSSRIPKVGEANRKLKELQQERIKEQDGLQAQIDALLKEKEQALELAQQTEEAFNIFKEQTAEAKAAIQVQKQNRLVDVKPEFNEAETRKHLIDVDLKEVGWHNLRAGHEIEYPVKGMPINRDNPRGNGFVDYVLWGDDGLPIAIVEAKRTSKDVEVGKHQAFLYANCLEAMHGQRPVIFYSNGYESMLWDDTFYSTPRRVHGFFTKDELQWCIQQRETRKDIRSASVNENIAGRPFQMEAIQRIAESFIVDGEDGLRGNNRNALLVMATGSGKTRTSAALVDVLFKNNWVKRVLFLADRNALVSQAKKNFGEHLPDLSSIDLTAEKENDTTRLVFSTYPSMMNRIDNCKDDEGRFYGVGHFDLIIVDEAHRSIYNRYGAIFEYFDAMVVGLTATPKDSIDHNTFELFGCSNDDPTFAFELEEATPLYLTPYKTIDVSTEFLREGIKYKDLSDEDKAKYEDTFEDKTTGLFPEEIKANNMNKWLFNKDTVNKVLDTLMTDGLRIEGGDKIGRTIIFAVNQNHAKFIVDCFTERYPEQRSGFISMIHNEVSHAQSLIEAFCDKEEENLPQIAVSVDMMDTGIDAPRVLNLIFFKVVRSYAKFWQMVGRGTRLCPDVFGPGQDKDHFIIFDVCQNFDFFEINKKGKESAGSKPITQQIFESRLQVSRLLAETGEDDNIALSKDLLDILHGAVAGLNRDRFQVDMKLRYVKEFSKRPRWNRLDSDDVHQIETHLSSLPSPELINETARRFDLLMLKLQLASLLMLGSQKGYEENLAFIAEELSKKYTIPQVLKHKQLLESMRDPDFYKELKQTKMESIRSDVRNLVQYLDKVDKRPIYLNIEDSEVVSTAREPLTNYGNSGIYKKRVERFVRENKSHITISKLSSNEPITEAEIEALEKILFDGQDRGTRDDYIKEYGEQPLGNFIRGIVGLSEESAREAFAVFIQAGNLQADQMTFLNVIITYLTTNGIIDKRMLFEAPFTDMNDQGLFGMFDDAEAGKIISIIDEINYNAMIG